MSYRSRKVCPECNKWAKWKIHIDNTHPNLRGNLLKARGVSLSIDAANVGQVQPAEHGRVQAIAIAIAIAIGVHARKK